MPSIVNGLFSGRSGISSHGAAIAVIGDNISNSSTVGYKTSRAEFQDLIAGGQTSSKVIGSGSSISAVSTIFEQGTFEFSGRPLDLAVDGNGLFVLDRNGERLYTRAGNFRVDEAGYIVNQNGLNVLGFPSGGSGSLEKLNINTVSQNGVATTTAEISGNLDSRADDVTVANIPTPTTTPPLTGFSQLQSLAQYSTVVDVFDSLGAKHTVTTYFFKSDAAANTWQARAYVDGADVTGGTAGVPAIVGSPVTLQFGSDGRRTNAPAAGAADININNVAWSNGSTTTVGANGRPIALRYDPMTQYASASGILSITQDGKGIGTVGSISIEKNGDIYALLNNGQSAVIGTVGLVNFSNPEGLVRTGGTLLQQSPSSGEPVIGRPKTGTFGAIQSGSLELSTVDIANEFVKLITIQRGFQANSRIITTINQLLNDIIQLA